MLNGEYFLRLQKYQPVRATLMMQFRVDAILFLFALSNRLLRMNTSMMRKQLSPQEMAWALERYSIILMGNMHSIRELTEFILQHTSFWENICTTTLLPISRNILVSKCIKGQCHQSADSSKWQFRHLMFRNALSMSLTTLMLSAPT